MVASGSSTIAANDWDILSSQQTWLLHPNNLWNTISWKKIYVLKFYINSFFGAQIYSTALAVDYDVYWCFNKQPSIL